MRKFTMLLAMTAVVGSAQASFELLLVADNGLNTFETRRIHRFEARTGTYLGSFGGFDSTMTSTWLRQSTNSLFVYQELTISEWDYNTGDLKNVWGATTGPSRVSVRPDGAAYAVFDGASDFLTYNFPTGGIIGSPGFIGGAQWRAGIWHSPNRLLAYSGAFNRFYNVDMNAAGTAGTATTNSVAVAPGFGQMARNAGTNQFVMAGGATVKTVDVNTLVAGTFASPFGTSQAAASAHNGYFIGGTNGTSGLITYYDSLGFRRAQFGGTVLRNPVSMEAVLAPEPGTMLALGAGLAAILRRRKARAK